MRNDRASAEYWSKTWVDAGLPPRIDPRDGRANNHATRVFDRYLRNAFAEHSVGPGSRLLEVGAGNSAWLPYLALEYGVRVVGLDYSAVGCEQLSRILARDAVNGDVIQADLFDPPARTLGAFDVVVSFGVAEHFENTAEAIGAFTRFLRPGGLLLTFVPNMAGILGSATRLINKPIYDIHVPLDADSLRRAHEKAGLAIAACDYLVFLDLGVVNLNGIVRGTPAWVAKRALLALSRRALRFTTFVEERSRWSPLTRATASFVVAVARAPGRVPDGA